MPSSYQSLQVPGTRSRISLSREEGQQVAQAVRQMVTQQMAARVQEPSFKQQTPKDAAAELRQVQSAAERDAAGAFIDKLPPGELDKRIDQRAAATPTPYTPRKR